jgi:hypothetical protein
MLEAPPSRTESLPAARLADAPATSLPLARMLEAPPNRTESPSPPDSPTVQRATEPPAQQPIPPVTFVQRDPDPTPAPAAQTTPNQPETEELVKKLFDPLLRRLKTELRLDRERRGALTDRPH